MRYYSNLAQEMTLTSGASAGDTTLSLSLVTGLPSSFPFTLVLDPGESNEEVVTCTNLVGTSATVVRGSDGTSATSHLSGAKVRHMISSRDLAEPQAHMATGAAVHGITGSVVGTTDAQALTNKTISGSSNTLSNVPKSALPTDVTYNATAQTLTNKSISGSSNTISNVPQSALPSTSVSTTGTQTLTNKTISGSSNTLSNIPSSALSSVDAAKITTGTISKSRLPADTMYLSDTGAVTSGFLSTASGWSNVSSSVQELNGVVFLDLVFTRTGAAISSSTNSGAVGDTLICTLSSYIPSRRKVAGCQYGGTSGGLAGLDGSGRVYFEHGAPGVDLGTGDDIYITFVYPA